MSEAPAVEVRDVSFAYDGELILEGADFTVAEREFLCIVGPNGGGKTTLLKLILGLLAPTRGTIRVFGRRPEEARPLVGYMPQDINHDLRFPVTVMDVVLMGRLGLTARVGPYRRRDREEARAALARVGMEGYERSAFSALSGGQRQRVLIARSLVSRPRMLLLDEPTSNVDIRTEDEFYRLLKKLQEEMTIIIVSHDLGFVSTYVERIVCVNRGVHVHPTRGMDETEIRRIYGVQMQLVRHDHFEHRGEEHGG